MNLSDTNLSSAYLYDADLSEASLVDTNLSEVYLVSVDLSGAYLRDTNLSGANLSYADFKDAERIESADFTAAWAWADTPPRNLAVDIDLCIYQDDLERDERPDPCIRFSANLFSANLSGAHLSNARFNDALGISTADFTDAWAWSDWPPRNLPPDTLRNLPSNILKIIDLCVFQDGLNRDERPDPCIVPSE